MKLISFRPTHFSFYKSVLFRYVKEQKELSLVKNLSERSERKREAENLRFLSLPFSFIAIYILLSRKN